MLYDHRPVLAKEVIDGLAIKPNGKYIDATFGRGGHSRAILNCLGPEGRLIALDQDPEAIKVAKSPPFSDDSRFSIEYASFAALYAAMEKRHWIAGVDGILADLGVSSPQLDDPNRGFSFMKEGPLDMRMDPNTGIDAATWLNQASAEEIAKILREYGEEKFSRRIANAIVKFRTQKPITTTRQLANLIAESVPFKERHKHPATRSFQAIRIFINDELGALKKLLTQSLEVLKSGGRICVISFHSLEDRIVKQFIQREAIGKQHPPGLPIRDADIQRRLKKIGGLIKPSQSEIATNPRARSARLRIAEKIA